MSSSFPVHWVVLYGIWKDLAARLYFLFPSGHGDLALMNMYMCNNTLV